MEKRDALSFRPQAWCFIDEPEAGITAALQGAVEVVHRKTDVVNTGTPLGDVLADRGVVGLCFEELHQRFAGRQSHDGVEPNASRRRAASSRARTAIPIWAMRVPRRTESVMVG